MHGRTGRSAPTTTLLLAAVALGATSAAHAQWSADDALSAPALAAGARLGVAVAADGPVAIAGAAADTHAGADSGCALVWRFDGSGWSLDDVLVATDAAAGDLFGSAVGVSGTVAVVGAPGDDDRGESAGAVYVFRYAGGDWSQEAKLTANDGVAGDRFGSAVAVRGASLIVGAISDGDLGTAAGSAYVFTFGGAAWSQQAKLLASDGGQADAFGIAVGIGDDHAIVGAAGDQHAGGTGSAYVFARSGASWSQQAKLTAATAGITGYGFATAIDGDRAVVGAMLEAQGGAMTGAAYVYARSGSNWPQEQRLVAANGALGDLFGRSVAISGDRVLVGAERCDGAATDSGAAWLFQHNGSAWVQRDMLVDEQSAAGTRLGAAVGLSGDVAVAGVPAADGTGATMIFRRAAMNGEWGGDRMGRALAAIDDIDGDGVVELLTGAPFNDAAGTSAGRALIFSGATGLLLRTHDGASAGDRFGSAVAPAGDFDCDGTGDYAVGAPERDGRRGRASVFSGADGSLLWQQDGAAAGDRLGWALAGGVDFDGDGCGDFAVSAPWHDGSATNAGRVWLHAGDGGAVIGTFSGAAAGDCLGWSLAALGDANGDGHGDLAVGAPRNDDAGGNSGKVYLYSGVDRQLLHVFPGAGNGSQFGRAIASAGDVNADGRDDLVVGAPLFDRPNRNNAGRVEVYSGATGVRLWLRQGANTGDQLGWAVAGAGDMNGDGHADVALAGPKDDTGGGASGRIYVGSGADASFLLIADGASGGDQLGYALAGAGDLNGDGLDDLAAAAPHHDIGGANSGRIEIWHGGAAAMMAGGAPARGADLNGDGIVDASEVLELLLSWGPCPTCPSDLDGDGMVNAVDAELLMAAWVP